MNSFFKQCLSDIDKYLRSVTPFGDPISPASQVRRAYEYHYGISEEEDELMLSDNLKAILERVIADYKNGNASYM